MHNEIVQASEARQRFFKLLEDLQKRKTPIIIEKKGRPVAVLENYQVHLGSGSNLSSKKGVKKLFKSIRNFKKNLPHSQADAVALIRTLRDEA